MTCLLNIGIFQATKNHRFSGLFRRSCRRMRKSGGISITSKLTVCELEHGDWASWFTHEKMGTVQFAKLTGYPENSAFLGQLLSRAGRLDLAIHLVSKDPRRRRGGRWNWWDLEICGLTDVWENGRRKFRSQTSDNMDRWKSRGGKSQRRERGRRKMQVREKVEKSRNNVFFQCFVALEGRKVGLLKRRVQSHLGRWEMNNCMPLWREEDLEAKRLKAPHVRSTFGSWDVEKVRGPVARSTFWSQNGQNTTCSEHFWKLRCWKSARRCGPKHISKPKCTKHTSVGALLEVEMMKKRRSLWHESHFKVKMLKSITCLGHFWTFKGDFSWQAQGILHAWVL